MRQEEYLQCLNGTEDARRAGYRPKTAHQFAYENLRKPPIRRIIQKVLRAREKAYIAQYADRI
ncbi:MAG: terminase small subunit [Sedimentisphaerales bacterium]|nr:terminase small subunit [Sedimentisphaerales bacterium]